MADSTFDIVSKVDKMEAENAVNQSRKELEQRYDFKGVGASAEWSGEKILLKANSEERVKAVLDVVQSKFIKRGISLKSLDSGEPYASGKEFRLEVALKQGIDQEHAKKIGKIIRDEAPKSVKSQIQGDELRVSSKSRDDLQETIRLLKGVRPRRRPPVRELPLTPVGSAEGERMPQADASASEGERMPQAGASASEGERMPQAGVDVPDRRGRTGLDRVGRDLDRNPRVRVREVRLLTSNWFVTRATTFDFQHADGHWTIEERETYDRGDGACILLYDVSARTVLLTRQFRFPAYVNEHPDGMLIETAAGLLDEDDPETAIRREAEEETGHPVGDVEHVFDAYMSPGSVTERAALLRRALPAWRRRARIARRTRPRGRGHRGARALIRRCPRPHRPRHRRREDDHAAAVGGAARAVRGCAPGGLTQRRRSTQRAFENAPTQNPVGCFSELSVRGL